MSNVNIFVSATHVTLSCGDGVTLSSDSVCDVELRDDGYTVASSMLKKVTCCASYDNASISKLTNSAGIRVIADIGEWVDAVNAKYKCGLSKKDVGKAFDIAVQQLIQTEFGTTEKLLAAIVERGGRLSIPMPIH